MNMEKISECDWIKLSDYTSIKGGQIAVCELRPNGTMWVKEIIDNN